MEVKPILADRLVYNGALSDSGIKRYYAEAEQGHEGRTGFER